jgi:molybdopterin-guanine dinucleotide biosynthesis protein A
MTAMPVCILAGGLGTRMGVLVRDAPKPLMSIPSGTGHPSLKPMTSLGPITNPQFDR